MPVFWMCFISSGGDCQFMQPVISNYYRTPSACARVMEKDKISLLQKIKKEKKQPDIFESTCISFTVESPRYTNEEVGNTYESKNIENYLALDVSTYKTKVIKPIDFEELEKDVEDTIVTKKPVVKNKESDYSINEAPRSFIIDCMRFMSLSKNDCEKSWFIK